MFHPCHQYRESFPWSERPLIPFYICGHETVHDRSNRVDVAGTVGVAVDAAADMNVLIHAAGDALYVIRYRDLPCQMQQKQQRLENERLLQLES